MPKKPAPFTAHLDLSGEQPLSLRLPPATTTAASQVSTTAAVDLQGRGKAIFLVGSGGTGKTVLARWMGWRAVEGDRETLLAALDPQNRTLTAWFDGVHSPHTSDSAASAQWLESLLTHVMEQQQSVVLDFGGGDTALARVVEATPNLAEMMTAAGVDPVLLYTLAPRQDDVVIMASLEELGFRPRATALVCNEGRVDISQTREDAFARVVRHPAVRAAVSRGAVPIWMPKLEAAVAQEIEGKRLHFGDARDGRVPKGATFPPMGGFSRSKVDTWLKRMEQAFLPIATWLP